jgi:hypothetical protein
LDEAPAAPSRPARAPQAQPRLRARSVGSGFRVTLLPARSQPGSLSVCDRSGRELRRLDTDPDGAWAWDGRDTQGQPVPSGRYQFRLLLPGTILRQWVLIERQP